MNDIRLFSKLIDAYTEETLEITRTPSAKQERRRSVGVRGFACEDLSSKDNARTPYAKNKVNNTGVVEGDVLVKYKKRIEHIINELYSFDGRFREIIERKRTIRTLTAEEETALTEFSQKRSKLIADLKTELKKIEQHPLIKKPEISIEEKPSVSENASPVPVVVAKPSSSKNTTDTVEEKKEKKSKAPAKKETTITFEDNSSSVHLDGVLKRHQDIPATRVIPRTPFAKLKVVPPCSCFAVGVLTKTDKEQEKEKARLAKEQEKEKARLAKEQEKREKLLVKEQEKENARLAKEQAKRSTKPVAKATKPKIEK